MNQDLRLEPLTVAEQAEIQANLEQSSMLKRLYGAHLGAQKIQMERTRSGTAQILCNHAQVYVREAERDLKCQACGKVLSAFDWLWKAATRQDNLFWRERELRQKVKRLSVQLGELKREERNIKARIRRATPKEA